MTTTNIGHVVANSLLMVANLLSHQSATKVTKLTVPELTQTNSSALILDCEFSVPDENFVLQWLFNGERPPVYEWRPNTEPVVVDLLRDRLDFQYNAADSPSIGRRSLRILRPGPELSGDYTCLVRSDAGAEDRATKTVLVFSPEHEFVLTIDYAEEFEVNCIARGLYPQPTLVLERNREQIPKQVWRNGSSYDARGRAALAPSALRDGERLACLCLCEQIPKQEQRIWRNGSSYDASGRAALAPSALRDGDRLACLCLCEQIPKQEQRIWRNGSSYDASGRAALAPSWLRDGDRLACRLLLPPAGYSAVREQVFRWDKFKDVILRDKCKKNMTKKAAAQLCRNIANVNSNSNICTATFTLLIFTVYAMLNK